MLLSCLLAEGKWSHMFISSISVKSISFHKCVLISYTMSLNHCQVTAVHSSRTSIPASRASSHTPHPDLSLSAHLSQFPVLSSEIRKVLRILGIDDLCHLVCKLSLRSGGSLYFLLYEFICT